MRLVSCLLVVVAALLLVGCASAPTSTLSRPATPHSADLECIEVFNAGPIR